jgi:predicted  nucleic acid-binding Zn-ribbon protein
MGGIMFTGYQSSTQKKEVAQAKVQYAKQDLNAAQNDTNVVVQKVETAKEWKTFNKSNFELKIKANEMRITELNEKINKPSELFDASYVNRIDNLEKENRFLKSRLEAYEKSQRNIGSI